MNDDHRDKLIINKLVAHLDADQNKIDQNSLSRLKFARMRALELSQRENNIAGFFSHWCSPAKITFALVTITAILFFAVIPEQVTQSPNSELIEIATSAERPEMIENLDFFLWMASAHKVENSAKNNK